MDQWLGPQSHPTEASNNDPLTDMFEWERSDTVTQRRWMDVSTSVDTLHPRIKAIQIPRAKYGSTSCLITTEGNWVWQLSPELSGICHPETEWSSSGSETEKFHIA